MKACISKGIFGWFILTLCVACSPETPTTQVENLEVKTTEETTQQVPPISVQKPESQTVLTDQVTPKKEEISAKPAAQNFARSYTAQELMEQIKKWEQNLKTLQTDFNQVSSYDGVEINRSKGRLYYDFTTGLLRWEMRTKEGEIDQVGITDKKEIIILDEALRPVTTLSWQEWQKGQPNQALFDIGNYAQLAKQHEVSLQAQDGKQATLAFSPKDQAQAYTLFITLAKKDFFPLEIAISADEMLTKNELVLVQKNNPISKELFGGFFK